jgi:hypothetical protein
MAHTASHSGCKHITRGGKQMARLSTNNAKIIVDDYETKVQLKELSDNTGKSMKAIIKQLVNEEYNKSGLTK